MAVAEASLRETPAEADAETTALPSVHASTAPAPSELGATAAIAAAVAAATTGALRNESRLCTICMDADKTHVFVPCGQYAPAALDH